MSNLNALANSATIQAKPLNEMTREELLAFIAVQQSAPARKISMKVSEKGALSLYGLGRFPVTLYRTQWERLLSPDQVKATLAFITANEKLLTVKE